MNNRKGFRYVPGLVLAGLLAVTALTNGCSAANAAEGCNGLDLTSEADASVQAFVGAVTALDAAASKTEAQWLKVCNEINGDLSLDTTKTNASDACGVLNAHIAAEKATLSITLTVSPPQCQADLMVEGTCNAQCATSAKCDATASCTPGQLVVGCNGTCDAACDVTAPSFMCSGTCKGECTASAAVMCSGECTGSCDAPMWTGTCDAGCTASFSGSCGGNCNGTCDGTNTTGTCKGKCVGTCDAKANGTCTAACTGMFTGGTCMGMCTGKCNAAAGASCNGSCNGTCSYMPGTATCTGSCHGNCSVKTTPPSCEGMLSCNVSANCQADCQAQASASLNCSPPQVTLAVTGDDALSASFQARVGDLGTALQWTLALKDPIANIVTQAGATASTFGSVSAAGVTCFASQASVAAHVQASISVSVSASATVQGQG